MTKAPLAVASHVLGSFFQCDPDLRLAGTEVYLDPAEPRKIGVISHGHSDHIGRHEHFVATPATADFLRLREGQDLNGQILGFGEETDLHGFTVTLHPAGHILGSAMVRIQRGGESLLYTGDFRLRASLTAEPAEVPRAGAIIMESTYGSPEWRFPSRDELAPRLVDLVGEIHARGHVPVLLAYSLGKSQEVLAMLQRAGVPVVLHPTVARVTEIYRRHGVDVGRWETWGRQGSLLGERTTTELRGKAVIVPPHMQQDIRRIARRETVALTGWALRGWNRGTDHALPLSDHADFDELLELVALARPETVYVTHGSERFAKELRARGIRAQFLKKKPQMRLF